MEYLDVTDIDGKPNGEQKPRAVIHSNGDWHNVAHIYVYSDMDGEKNILVHLRSKTKDLSPNKWDTRFGGHVKSGETVEKTVIEELEEEIGIHTDISNLEKVITYPWDMVPNREVIHAYLYKYTGDIKDCLFKDEEVQEVKWMPISKILDSLKNNPSEWSGGGDTENINKIIPFLSKDTDTTLHEL